MGGRPVLPAEREVLAGRRRPSREAVLLPGSRSRSHRPGSHRGFPWLANIRVERGVAVFPSPAFAATRRSTIIRDARSAPTATHLAGCGAAATTGLAGWRASSRRVGRPRVPIYGAIFRVFFTCTVQVGVGCSRPRLFVLLWHADRAILLLFFAHHLITLRIFEQIRWHTSRLVFRWSARLTARLSLAAGDRLVLGGSHSIVFLQLIVATQDPAQLPRPQRIHGALTTTTGSHACSQRRREASIHGGSVSIHRLHRTAVLFPPGPHHAP